MRVKLPSIDAELMEKGTFRCNGRRSCQICPLMREGDTFHNFDSTRSFKNFSGRYDCNSDHVVYLLQCESCNKKYVGSTKTKFGKGLMLTSPILGHTHANTTKILLIKGSLSHRLVFSVISLKTDTMGLFGWVSQL